MLRARTGISGEGREHTMNQYGAHILATVRGSEFAAAAAESRRAAAVREHSTARTRAAIRRRIPAQRPATT
jgi:hypothetical protein